MTQLNKDTDLVIGGERLLHYVWQNKLWQCGVLKTDDGQLIEVINTGKLNMNAGPDFFGATVRINDTIWVGNIEIHIKSSDWYNHHHHTNEQYNNVILHVCEQINQDVYNAAGRKIPQIAISVPQYVKQNYHLLLNEMDYPPCYKVLPKMRALVLHGWMDKLCVDRLEQKTTRINHYLEQNNFDWEKSFFIALSRAFGFGVNSEVFELWASEISLQQIAHHRDNILQIEAYFFGQAGMFNDNYLKDECKDDYYRQLQSEYQFLKNKYSLVPIDGKLWKFLRMRPQNFPTIRLAQLASLYVSNVLNLQTIIELDSIKSIQKILTVDVSDYWQTHYTFGKESKPCHKRIQNNSLQRLVINAVCPVLFSYGTYSSKDELTERSFDLLHQIPAEDDHIVRRWKSVGINAESAADSQALNHLYTNYCQRKDCLRCAIGREYLKCDSY